MLLNSQKVQLIKIFSVPQKKMKEELKIKIDSQNKLLLNKKQSEISKNII
jgi:hypothetical protein